jgi:DNA polymerase-4
VGVGPNKLVAKIASDLNKPDGLYVVHRDRLQATLDPLPIHKLFGIGQKSLPAVEAAGILSFGDLRQAPPATLWKLFGKHGQAMRDRAAGIDDRQVLPAREEKSLSAEETFAVDIRDVAQLERQLSQLSDRTAARLRAHGLAAGTVSVKIRRQDFTTYTRQRGVEPATQETAVVSAVAAQLFGEWRAAQPQAAVRLLGVGVGNLQILRQADLFSGEPRESRLDATIDGIRERFGSELLTRASLLPRSRGGSRPR